MREKKSEPLKDENEFLIQLFQTQKIKDIKNIQIQTEYVIFFIKF